VALAVVADSQRRTTPPGYRVGVYLSPPRCLRVNGVPQWQTALISGDPHRLVAEVRSVPEASSAPLVEDASKPASAPDSMVVSRVDNRTRQQTEYQAVATDPDLPFSAIAKVSTTDLLFRMRSPDAPALVLGPTGEQTTQSAASQNQGANPNLAVNPSASAGDALKKRSNSNG